MSGRVRSIPEMPGIDEIDYLTNSSMMHVDFLPKHLVIIGGSYVGLEFESDVSPLRQPRHRH